MATTAHPPGDSAAGLQAAVEAIPGSGQQDWPSLGWACTALVLVTLATMMNFLDIAVFQLTGELIKRDFGLTDFELGLLLGPAGIFFYVFVGIPLARLVDIYRRTFILGLGILVTSGMTALGGLAQSFGQFFASRLFVGVGGSAHGPGTYSLLADYFRPKHLPRAFAFLQLGFILGNGLGAVIGGVLLGHVADWEPSVMGPLLIRNWQWVFVFVAIPGLIVAALLFLLPEPPRRGTMSEGRALPVSAVLREIHARRRVYYPLFLGLAISALEAGGLAAWRAPFMMRTYGWTPEQIGAWSGITFLVAMPIGVAFGTWLTEFLMKRTKDAPVRTTAYVFALAIPFSVASPLMPTGELAVVFGALAGVFAIAAAVPQNVAIQTVTPNEMRGQVTAVYLFMFIVFGALGASVVPLVTTYVAGGEDKLWISMMLVAAVLLPLAVYAISRGMAPYAHELERLEQISAEGLSEAKTAS